MSTKKSQSPNHKILRTQKQIDQDRLQVYAYLGEVVDKINALQGQREVLKIKAKRLREEQAKPEDEPVAQPKSTDPNPQSESPTQGAQ